MLEVLIDRRLLVEFFANRDKYASDADFIMYSLLKPVDFNIRITDKVFEDLNFYQKKMSHFYDFDNLKKYLEKNTLIIQENDIQQARCLRLKDFDAAIELVCAIRHDCGAIVTLSPESYVPLDLPLLSVENFIKRARLEKVLTRKESQFFYSTSRISRISTEDLNEIDLEGVDLAETDFRGVDFVGKSLRFSNFENCNFKNCNFKGADLFRAKLRGANLEGANLEGANLEHADLVLLKGNNSSFSGANLKNADFSSSKLNGAIFCHSNLSFSNLTGAEIRGGDFRESNLVHADLSYATLNGSNLMKADFSFAELKQTQFSLCDVRDAIFTELISTRKVISN